MKFKEYEITAECFALSSEGKGMVYYNDQVGLIDNLLVGEKARIKVTYRTSNRFVGYPLEIFNPSKDRIKPICPHFSLCGGCALMHMNYEAQLEYKKDKVKSCLEKIGGFKDINIDKVIGMDVPYNYRNKIQVPLGMKNNKIISGFYKERSHEIIPITECYIEDKKASSILSSIKTLMKDFNIKPYDEDNRTGVIRHILIKTSKHYPQIMVVLVTNVDEFKGKNNFVKALIKKEPSITTVVQNINTRDTNVILGEKERVLYGTGHIKDDLLGLSFKISSKSFFQVNPVQTEKLYTEAISSLNISKEDNVLDAYCGIGTIGLIASKYSKHVVGVEIVKDAVKDAIYNAKMNKIDNISFYNDDAGKFIIDEYNKGNIFDVVIMDPPRKGSSEEFINVLLKSKPKKIVYVSCDPATLARDLKLLSKGYSINKVSVVDMFPNSFHVESIATLSLKR